MYEKKVADMMKQLAELEAHYTSAEKELNRMRAMLSNREELLQVNILVKL